MTPNQNLTVVALPTNTDAISIELKKGSVIYIVGPNGSGKSSLLTFITKSANNINHKRISAFRQISFSTSQLNITPYQRKSLGNEFANRDRQERSRWMDDYSEQRINTSLYDLIHSENSWNKEIAELLRRGDDGQAKLKSKQDSPLAILNDVLAIGALSVRISISNDDDIVAKRGDNALYGINKMSDGERNAVLLAAEILTAKNDSLIIIDEPERHLHRSITVPVLAALFQRRPDCSFVVSTHDVELPSTNPNSTVVIIRDCIWIGEEASRWDLNILEKGTDIPSDIKHDILGSRKKILFIEGMSHSLDLGLYSILFPNVTVSPRGSCSEIERIVKGIKNSSELHWIEPYGLIDRDDRTIDQVAKLQNSSIFAMERFSIESLYYSSVAITSLAKRQLMVLGEKLGENAEKIAGRVAEAGIQALAKGNSKRRLCARRYERRLRSLIVARFPKWKEIESSPDGEIEIKFAYSLEEECKIYQNMLDSKNWDGLAARYPLRETNALDAVSTELRFNSKEDYEAAVRKAVMDDNSTREDLRQLIGALADVLR